MLSNKDCAVQFPHKLRETFVAPLNKLCTSKEELAPVRPFKRCGLQVSVTTGNQGRSQCLRRQSRIPSHLRLCTLCTKSHWSRRQRRSEGPALITNWLPHIDSSYQRSRRLGGMTGRFRTLIRLPYCPMGRSRGSLPPKTTERLAPTSTFYQWEYR